MLHSNPLKKIIRWLLIVVVLLMVTAGIFYKIYYTDIVAKTLSSDYLPDYIPGILKARIEKVQKPVNESADAVIASMHKSGVTLDQIFKAIDDAKEEQAYAMLDELNKTTITDVDQFFDIGKKFFPVDFDVEIFRDAYHQKVNLPLIKKAIKYANIYKKENRMDAETAKEIAKKILKTKEDEFHAIVGE